MDLGFLTKLLAGQGGANSPMSMLLPMILGAKGTLSGSAGTPDVMGMISGLMGQKREEQTSFPPLFGNENEGDRTADSGLWNMLGSLMPSQQKTKDYPKNTSEYPYELQYNHPYPKEK